MTVPRSPPRTPTAAMPADASSHLGELVPTGGGDPIPLKRSPLVVGRRDRCDVVLPFDNVSGQHCELELRDGFWHVRDLDSSNGIRVDGQRCMESALPPGTVLKISKHEYEVVYTPTGDGPAPATAVEEGFGGSLMELAGIEKSGRKPSKPRPKRTLSEAELGGEPDEEEDEALRLLMGDD